MPKRTVTVYTDDLDGKDLPEDTKPVRLSLGRTTYGLYLSDVNEGKLYEALEPFTKNAEKLSSGNAAPQAGSETGDLPRGAKSAYNAAKKDQTDTFKQWAKDNKVGLPAKGAASQEHYDAFFEANDTLPRLIGRGTVSVEEWHAQQS